MPTMPPIIIIKNTKPDNIHCYDLNRWLLVRILE